ncbi:hypothetical protein MUK42_35870 [Musa troglodytarum]|nr:hypothetical protein MUK42_35870 [Musa troglodytarum]URE29062.1 hypothetical protein MUK42_35870 [Musa troglodytarum]URE29064.1 hypothetical protein MUK42_35870 [Musa troglodytarum]
MPPSEVDSAIDNLVKVWIKKRAHKRKEYVDQNSHKRIGNQGQTGKVVLPLRLKFLLIIDETLDVFFQLPIQMQKAMLSDLLEELDKSLQNYALKEHKAVLIPPLPALTRCEIGSKPRKKREKLQDMPKGRSQVGSKNGDGCYGLSQLCIRIRTLSQPKQIMLNGLHISFKLIGAACHEGILLLCETTAYKVIFHDSSHVLWDALYIGDTASCRIDPFIKELDPAAMEMISNTVPKRLVLLADGPFRAFSRQDSEIIEDFRLLKEIYLAAGAGLP